MEKSNISIKTCELLAKLLIEEQAEALKHEAIVKDIKKTIMDKKMEVVSNLVEGRVFEFDNKETIVFDVKSFEMKGRFYIELTFGQLPASATFGVQLTKKESELMDQYARALDHCCHCFQSDWYSIASRAANALADLKNGIRLIERSTYGFNFDDAIDPDFFKKTGITVERFCGCNYKRMSLEETSRKIR